MYITDYTERSDLATPPTALWSRELQGRIVTLELQGPQSKMADKVDIGAFFNVKHMRLIERVMGVGRVVGRIGGPDRLIHKLNANNPNEELEQLFRYVKYLVLGVADFVTLQSKKTMGGREGISDEADRGLHHHCSHSEQQQSRRQVQGSCASCRDISLAVERLRRSLLQRLLRTVRCSLLDGRDNAEMWR